MVPKKDVESKKTKHRAEGGGMAHRHVQVIGAFRDHLTPRGNQAGGGAVGGDGV